MREEKVSTGPHKASRAGALPAPATKKTWNVYNHPRWQLVTINFHKDKDTKIAAIYCNRCDMYMRAVGSCEHGRIPEELIKRRDFVNKITNYGSA